MKSPIKVQYGSNSMMESPLKIKSIVRENQTEKKKP